MVASFFLSDVGLSFKIVDHPHLLDGANYSSEGIFVEILTVTSAFNTREDLLEQKLVISETFTLEFFLAYRSNTKFRLTLVALVLGVSLALRDEVLKRCAHLLHGVTERRVPCVTLSKLLDVPVIFRHLG